MNVVPPTCPVCEGEQPGFLREATGNLLIFAAGEHDGQIAHQLIHRPHGGRLPDLGYNALAKILGPHARGFSVRPEQFHSHASLIVWPTPP